MPPIYRQRSAAGWIAAAHNQLRAASTSQQQTFSDGEGRPVMNLGLAPASNPAQYGLQLVNAPTGAQLAMFGVQDDGTNSLRFYASDGTTVLIQLDDTGLSSLNSSGEVVTKVDAQGIHIYDSSGVELIRLGVQSDGTVSLKQMDSGGHGRTIMGQMLNGDYGLAVYSPANDGTYQEIRPMVAVSATNTVPVGSTSYEAIGPSLSATIGASGSALVTLTADIALTVANQQGVANVFIDGAQYLPEVVVGTSSTSGNPTAQITACASVVVTGLSPGAHSFEIFGYTSTAGQAFNIAERSIIVQPL